MIDTILGGKYRIGRLLGRGGMGAVYEAEEIDGGRRVAIKVIHAELAKREVAITRFYREVRAVAAIETPHIAHVYEAGTNAGSGEPYMVMEHLEGEDLQQVFRRIGQLPPDLALRIVHQAALGLGKAHEARVIHRDIKPANIFLARREEDQRIVKLLDFGIAKIKPDDHSHIETTGLTRAGSMLGSPHYMSPEQARGAKSIDTRADIWSLGIVLYQALTGAAPHKSIDALGELIIAITSQPPKPVQETAPWVSPAVAAIVHRALRFDPALRFQSADEMAEAIGKLLPNGDEIDEDALAPIAEGERSKRAPVWVDPAPERSPLDVMADLHHEETSPASAGQVGPGEISTPDAVSSDGGPAPPSVAAPAASRGPGSLPAPVKSRATALIGALAVVAAAAIGYAAVGGSKSPAVPTAAPAPPSAPAPPAASSALAPVPTVDAKPRRVKVVVIPANASVEVDGAPTRAKDGVIEIEGPLDSVHRVKLKAGGGEIERDVVITDSGALPPKVELVGR